MTGLAQVAGDCGAARWTWEIKTVNAKGLDLRLRLPPSLDLLELEARKHIGARLARGTCHAVLTVAREKLPVQLRVDTEKLAALTRALAEVPLPPGIGRRRSTGCSRCRAWWRLSSACPIPLPPRR